MKFATGAALTLLVCVLLMLSIQVLTTREQISVYKRLHPLMAEERVTNVLGQAMKSRSYTHNAEVRCIKMYRHRYLFLDEEIWVVYRDAKVDEILYIDMEDTTTLSRYAPL